MAPGLASPYGNGPKDIPSDVPGGMSLASLQQAAAVPAGQPAKLGAAPVAPAAGAAPPSGEENPYLVGARSSKHEGTEEGANPYLQAHMDQQNQEYHFLGAGLRNNKRTDKWEVQTDKGWEPVSDYVAQGLAHFAKNDLPRLAGMSAGATLGAIGGPVGSVMGAGAGAALGGLASNVQQGKPTTFGGVASDAIAGVAGQSAPLMVAGALKSKAAQYVERAIAAEASNAGAEVITANTAKRMVDAQKAGVTLRPDEINPEDPAVNNTIQGLIRRGGFEAGTILNDTIKRTKALSDTYQKIWQGLKGGHTVEDGSGYAANFNQFFSDMVTKLRGSIGADAEKLYEVAGNKVYPDKVKAVMGAMRQAINGELGTKANLFHPSGEINEAMRKDIILKQGSLPEGIADHLREYQNLMNASKEFEARGAADQNPGSHPEMANGFTLRDLDELRKQYQDRANFNGMNRSRGDQTWGEIAHSTRMIVDDVMADVASKSNPELAARIRANKDFYSLHKEAIENFGKLVEHDPTNAAGVLVNPKNPAQVRELFALLKPEQQKYLAGGFLEHLAQPAIDPQTGVIRLGNIQTSWKKVDPEIKRVLFGEAAPQIDAILNTAKLIENKNPVNLSPKDQDMLAKFLGFFKHPEVKTGAAFIGALFPKNVPLQEYLIGQAGSPKIYNVQAMKGKAAFYDNASRAALWGPSRLGAADTALKFGDYFKPDDGSQGMPNSK